MGHGWTNVEPIHTDWANCGRRADVELIWPTWATTVLTRLRR